MTVEEYTYQDFLTYLLLMGAQADMNISEDEKDLIVQKVGEVEFKRVKRCFDQHNDAQRIDMISQLYQKFETQIGGKEQLVMALREFITANNRSVHVMDRYLMMMLKRIL